MKKNDSNMIIKLTTKLFKYLSKLNCVCCNSKCSAVENNGEIKEKKKGFISKV